MHCNGSFWLYNTVTGVAGACYHACSFITSIFVDIIIMNTIDLTVAFWMCCFEYRTLTTVLFQLNMFQLTLPESILFIALLYASSIGLRPRPTL